MSDPTRAAGDSSSGPANKSFLGIAAVACVACCIGPILAFLGAIAALGVLSTVLMGSAGALIVAAVLAAFVGLRRRRTRTTCTLGPEPVPVELEAANRR